MHQCWKQIVVLLLAASSLWACSEEFKPIELVQGLRVMGIAADIPDLAPGEKTTIRALVRAEPDTQVSYAWDWCPFEATSANEYTCPIGQEDFDELAVGLGFDPPQLVLGNSPEVEFNYTFSELLKLYCALISSNLDEVPEGEGLLDCEDRLAITLRLIVTDPNGGRVVAVKRMSLLYDAPEDPTVVNSNPFIDGVSIVLPGKSSEEAVPLVDGEPFPVEYDQAYTVLLELDDATSEMFTPEGSERDSEPEPKRENLLAFWYYEGGEYDEEKTGFVDGVSTFESLRENTLTTPEAGNFSGELNLYFVLLDEREGIGWTVRTLVLE